MLDLKIYS